MAIVNLCWEIRERRSDRDYDDVKVVGKAASHDAAREILKDYAKRCANVSWYGPNEDEADEFSAFMYDENFERHYIEVWICEVGTINDNPLA